MKGYAMKKTFTLILAAVIMLGILSSCAKEKDVPSGFMRASNEACDFDFFVPDTWTLSQSSGTVAAYCSPTDPSSISVMPAELEHADSTVDDWWAAHKSDFESVYDDFTMISEVEATLGGIKGKCYTFTAKLASSSSTGDEGESAEDTGVTYYFEITAVVKHSRIYMMTFTSTDTLYENHTSTLETVKEHFSFH